MLKKFFKHTTNTFKSLFIIFKHLFKKPVTLEYPEKRKILPKKFRGKPSLKSGCVKCRTCIRVCPSGAIKLDDNNNIIFDLEKCIICGNCSFYCPKSVIEMSKDFELATCDKKDLKLIYKNNKENV